MKEYIHIGRIVASFGLKGEVILKHALGKKTVLKDIDALFIEEQKGRYLPYFVESSKARDQEETYVKLEGVDTRESATRLSAKNAWLLEADFRKLAGKSSAISLIGYQVVEGNDELGQVLEVIEQPHQVLLRIDLAGKEAYIPLHGETLERIDHKTSRVYVVLPEGLLDIYR